MKSILYCGLQIILFFDIKMESIIHIYFSLYVAPEKGVTHHYRRCRPEWQVPLDKAKQNQFGNRTKCDEFPRYNSTDMLLLSKAIEKNVLKIIEELKISTN